MSLHRLNGFESGSRRDSGSIHPEGHAQRPNTRIRSETASGDIGLGGTGPGIIAEASAITGSVRVYPIEFTIRRDRRAVNCRQFHKMERIGDPSARAGVKVCPACRHVGPG
jgi:hypothetical protein